MRILTLLLIFVSLRISARTIEVCATCEVKTIKEAVLMAQDYDSVLVKSGTYKESKIEVTKSINIVGVGLPVLDGGNLTESIFVVRAHDFNISGFKFTNVGFSYTKEIAGIFVSEGKNFVPLDPMGIQ